MTGKPWTGVPNWSTRLEGWEDRAIARQSLLPCGPLFPDEAAKAMEIFTCLRLVDVPGSPRVGDACRPWMLDFARVVFGSCDPETGRRLIRYYLLTVAKKNGKSSLAAAIMLTCLIRNWRRSAEFLVLAPTIEIAANCFHPARDMVRADPKLLDLLRIQDNFRTILHRNTGATLKVVAADNETVSGKKAAGVLVDELWLFGKRANAENMLREAIGGLASRPEGFVIYLSTQSDTPPAGVFKQRLQEFRDIRDGKVVDPKSLPVLYEFPKRMIDSGEYRDPRNFYITNPSLGTSVDEEFLIDEFTKAERAGEVSLASFVSKHLNVELGLALGSDAWAGAAYWQDQADPTLTLEAVIERSDVLCVGIDGGGLDDLMALAVIGRDATTRDWLVWSQTWAHPIVLERRKAEAPRLLDFAAAGELVIVDRIGQDVEEIADLCERLDATGKLAQIGLDAMGIGAVIDALEAKHIAGDRLVAVSQGWKLSGAIKTAERKLAEGTLRHSGQAITAWAVGNAKVEPRGNAITITKAAAGAAKIDPVMAMLDGVALMSNNPVPVRRPQYQMYFFGRGRGSAAAGPF
jgi:phage terminase large subunit-like protein